MEKQKRLKELEIETKDFMEHLTRSFSVIENLDLYYIKGSLEAKQKLLSILFPESLIFENPAYRTHPENLLVSAMINKIKGFERGEIKKADISAGFSRLAPLIVKLSKRFSRDNIQEVIRKITCRMVMAS